MNTLDIVFAALILTSLSEATCYLPNGTAYEDPGTQPCSTDPATPLYSVCCHGKWDNPPGNDIKDGSTKDECLPNGMCRNQGFSTIPGQEFPAWTHYYRVYCTNQDWSSCLNICDIGVGRSSLIAWYFVYQKLVEPRRSCPTHTMRWDKYF